MGKDLLRTLPPADCAISKLTKNKGSGWRKETFFPNMLGGLPGFEIMGNHTTEAIQICVSCNLCSAITYCVENSTGDLITAVIPVRLMDRSQKILDPLPASPV